MKEEEKTIRLKFPPVIYLLLGIYCLCSIKTLGAFCVIIAVISAGLNIKLTFKTNNNHSR